MQTIQIIGYLGKDAEIKQFGNSEQKFIVFTVGVTRQYKNSEPRTTWYYCTHFYREGGKLAETLTKGKRVLVSGEFSLGVFIPQDGSDKQVAVSPRIASNKIIFLDSKSQQGQGKQQQTVSEDALPLAQTDMPPDLENLEAELLKEVSQEYSDSADDLPF